MNPTDLGQTSSASVTSTPSSPSQNQPAEPRFEQAIGELEQIVQRLSQPNVDLDEALSLYERGVQLTQRGRALISHAEGRVSQLRQSLAETQPGGPDAPRA